MVQLSDDCCNASSSLLRVEQAREIIQRNFSIAVLKKTLSLEDTENLVLAEDIIAPFSLPPHDNSAVDGFGISYADLAKMSPPYQFALQGTAKAGHVFPDPLLPFHAIKIFTGAVLPSNVDTIYMLEDCEINGDKVTVPAGLKKGSNTRQAGEDITKGQVILHQGIRLRPSHIGVAASLGLTALTCYMPLRVTIFSSGDEITRSSQMSYKKEAGRIFDSNTPMLKSLLHRLGVDVTDGGVLPDHPQTIRYKLQEASQRADLIISSGGVSVGEEDHMKAVITEIGKIDFWRLAIKPGKPLAMGYIGQIPYVGLPGNPVASFVTFAVIARFLVAQLGGERPFNLPVYNAIADFSYQKKIGRREYLRITLTRSEGILKAHKFPREGAGILTSLTNSHALAELPERLTSLSPGDPISFIPLEAIYG
ncbi:molybdopterin molybdotransferase MoeA [Entomobacter blattae]|uniref:Molybdopterin molybdenumtransferase n=1 Tax=Entomobacter blattae TaxID=2762277 RepID=A0A7H1NT29_9PROT|nr:gephyrin-like molybdotransferase Glp [Entomobacter blattae]QNT78939.1 Molybdopterin molybdenumtransferase [Entomobacter blattae]